MSALAGAGLVYLSGGSPPYLADTLRGTVVLEAILAAWRGGAALAGCSAGACALTAVAIDPGRGADRPGLAVVPELVVLPHFDRIEQWSPGIVERRLNELRPGQVLLGIDEKTALVGAEGVWRVEGAGHVWVVDTDGARTPHGAGNTPVLPAAAPGSNPEPSRK